MSELDQITVVSFLGTTRYSPCYYISPEGWSEDREVFAESGFLLPLLVRWLKEKYRESRLDIKVCCTKDSEAENFPKLKETLSKTFGPGGGYSLTMVPIKEGRNPQELWENFSVLEREVPEGAKVVLDVTHGFRSLPLVAVAIMEFLRASKGVELLHVIYGAYELGQKKQAPQPIVPPPPPEELPHAPVLDLKDLVTIIDWANAKRIYDALGEPSVFRELLKGNKSLRQWLEKVSKILEIAHVPSFAELATEKRPSVDESFSPPIRKLLQGAIKQGIEDLLPKKAREEEALLEASLNMLKHYLDHGRLMHAIALLREAIVLTMFVRGLGGQLPSSNKERRKSLQTAENSLRPWTGANAKVAKERFGEESPEFALVQLFDKVVKLRNEAMHCGLSFEDQAPPDSKSWGKVSGDFEKLRQLADRIDLSVGQNLKNGPRGLRGQLFANISHHPWEMWPKEQVEKAMEKVGEGGMIVDVGFPEVDPTRTDPEYIKELVNKIENDLEEVEGRTNKLVTCAMVQGEAVLTFAMVKRLQKKGIRCYAATTDRIVEERPDGTRTYRFAFREFREYPVSED